MSGGGNSGRKKTKEASPPPPIADEQSEASSAEGDEPFVRQVLDYESWKETLPVLYDCFIHSNLEWPSYACAWGPVVPEAAPNSGAPAGGSTLAPPNAASSSSAASSAANANNPAAPAQPAPVLPHLTESALVPQLYSSSYVTQTFYFSRSTDSKLEKDKWVGSPNMLLKAEIYYPNQYRTQDISKMRNFDEDQRNPALIIRKKIVHPGEINRIKIMPQYPDLIATHTDSPLVYIWNTNTQISRRSALNTDPSIPDLTLQGHSERDDCNTLYYALDCSKHAPLVISGGSDQKICLWNIQDYCSTLLTTAHVEAQKQNKSAGPTKKHIDRLLSPRQIFTGHTAQVEEVVFHPNHPDLLASVGDDRALMIWDPRQGTKPVVRLNTTHKDDVNAVHWNSVNDNLLVTGSSDHTVKLIDLRHVTNSDSFAKSYSAHPGAFRGSHNSAVIETFNGHNGNVTNVQWHSDGVHFASGSDDGDLCVWSIKGVEALRERERDDEERGVVPLYPSLSAGIPPSQLWDGSADGQARHLLFRHAGHRTSVVNFAWNNFVLDGWTMASLSDDSADETLVGGGRLHVWRVTDLLTNPWNKIVDEFAGSGANQTGGDSSVAPSASPPATSPMELSGETSASNEASAMEVDADDMPEPDSDSN